MSFAPPADLNTPPPPTPADLPDDPTDEDAYARRMRLSQQHDSLTASGTPSAGRNPPQMQQAVASSQAAVPSSFPAQPAQTISRAPVRYNLPPAPPELPESEAELEAVLQQEDAAEATQIGDNGEDTPRSLRPGQKGFAERLMSKYGWTKGTGLGANNSGIINPLRVQIEKQKKKPDSEGGGFVGPGGRGKILGGKRKGGESDSEFGKFGPMSEVVILKGMVSGMDVEHELQEGNLMQEIGEECAEKVEYLVIG